MVHAMGARSDFGTLIPAANYLRVRALGAWAFHVNAVGMAAMFSSGDSFTPFMISILGGIVNFAGDWFLCPRMSSCTVGAALATVVSQLLCLSLTLSFLCRRGQLPSFPKTRLKRSQIKKFVTGVVERSRVYFSFAGPLTALLIVRIGVYAWCGRMCCQLGAVGAAAHQIGNNIWWGCSSLTAEPLDAAILTFLPAKLHGGDLDEPHLSKEALSTIRRSCLLGVISGLIVAPLVAFSTCGDKLKWLISDPTVLAAVPRRGSLLSCIFVGPALVLEGALICLNQMNLLVVSIGIAGLISCGAMSVTSMMGKTAGACEAVMTTRIWDCVALFVGLRLFGNLLGTYATCHRLKQRHDTAGASKR
mmetsp:Transcript_20188/g.27442  ORF Transcript_20188/g.27442 Transcript_20188/m.27442 type:complete len:361 (-) Transcript_20188:146-1228(-)